MKIITTEEVMSKLNMFQVRFGKVDEFGWWDLERILADAGTQFTSKDFQDECQTHVVQLTLAALENQEMNIQVKLTWITFRIIVHSIMGHAQVLEDYAHFALMYTEDRILPLLPIK